MKLYGGEKNKQKMFHTVPKYRESLQFAQCAV